MIKSKLFDRKTNAFLPFRTLVSDPATLIQNAAEVMRVVSPQVADSAFDFQAEHHYNIYVALHYFQLCGLPLNIQKWEFPKVQNIMDIVLLAFNVPREQKTKAMCGDSMLLILNFVGSEILAGRNRIILTEEVIDFPAGSTSRVH